MTQFIKNLSKLYFAAKKAESKTNAFNELKKKVAAAKTRTERLQILREYPNKQELYKKREIFDDLIFEDKNSTLEEKLKEQDDFSEILKTTNPKSSAPPVSNVEELKDTKKSSTTPTKKPESPITPEQKNLKEPTTTKKSAPSNSPEQKTVKEPTTAQLREQMAAIGITGQRLTKAQIQEKMDTFERLTKEGKSKEEALAQVNGKRGRPSTNVEKIKKVPTQSPTTTSKKKPEDSAKNETTKSTIDQQGNPTAKRLISSLVPISKIEGDSGDGNAAQDILDANFALEPLILERTGRDNDGLGSYRVVSGDLNSARKAKELDPRFETINAIVLDDSPNSDAIRKQLELASKQPNKGKIKVDPNDPDFELPPTGNAPLRGANLVPIKAINAEVENEYNQEEIDEYAREILKAGGLAKPLVVRRTGVDSFDLASGDEFAYLAAKRAQELDPKAGAVIDAVIREGGNRSEAINRQLQSKYNNNQTKLKDVPSQESQITSQEKPNVEESGESFKDTPEAQTENSTKENVSVRDDDLESLRASANDAFDRRFLKTPEISNREELLPSSDDERFKNTPTPTNRESLPVEQTRQITGRPDPRLLAAGRDRQRNTNQTRSIDNEIIKGEGRPDPRSLPSSEIRDGEAFDRQTLKSILARNIAQREGNSLDTGFKEDGNAFDRLAARLAPGYNAANPKIDPLFVEDSDAFDRAGEKARVANLFRDDNEAFNRQAQLSGNDDAKLRQAINNRNKPFSSLLRRERNANQSESLDNPTIYGEGNDRLALPAASVRSIVPSSSSQLLANAPENFTDVDFRILGEYLNGRPDPKRLSSATSIRAGGKERLQLPPASTRFRPVDEIDNPTIEVGGSSRLALPEYGGRRLAIVPSTSADLAEYETPPDTRFIDLDPAPPQKLLSPASPPPSVGDKIKSFVDRIKSKFVKPTISPERIQELRNLGSIASNTVPYNQRGANDAIKFPSAREFLDAENLARRNIAKAKALQNPVNEKYKDLYRGGLFTNVQNSKKLKFVESELKDILEESLKETEEKKQLAKTQQEEMKYKQKAIKALNPQNLDKK